MWSNVKVAYWQASKKQKEWSSIKGREEARV